LTALQMPSGSVDHRALITAIHRAGLATISEAEVKLVFSPKTFLTCGSLAMLCAWGRARRLCGCHFSLSATTRPADVGYPARMDLFTHLGVPFDEPFTRHDSEGRFQPLLLIGEDQTPMEEAVAKILDLVRNRFVDSERFLPALSWIIQELIDNIVNHAKTDIPGVVCAQFYPGEQRLDLAIWDSGVGLEQSLLDRYPDLMSHGDAISHALRADTTRDSERFQGNGLAGAREIVAANGGDLLIWTGDATKRFVEGEDKGFVLTNGELTLPGTGLQISLRTERPVDLEQTSLTRGTRRILLTEAATLIEGEMIPLADADTRGGRVAARALREQLLPRIASDQTIHLDFAGVLMPAHSFLDEFLGKTAREIGLTRFLDKVRFENCPSRISGSIERVLTQRFVEESDGQLEKNLGKPHVSRVEKKPELKTGGSKAPTKQLSLICDPHTIVLWNEDMVDKAWCQSAWPSAKFFFETTKVEPITIDETLSRLHNYNKPLLLIPPIRPLPSEVLTRNTPAFLISRLSTLGLLDKILMMVPPATLEDKSDFFREHIWEADPIRWLMEVQTNLFGQANAARVQLLGLGPLHDQETANELTCFDSETLLAEKKPEKNRDKIRRLLDPYSNLKDRWGFRHIWQLGTVPDPIEDHPDQKKRRNDWKERLEMIRLGELLSALFTGTAPEGVGGEGTVVLREADLNRPDLSLDMLEEADWSEDACEDHLLQTGDLVLPIRISEKCAPRVIDDSLAGCRPDDSLIVLRLEDPALAPVISDLFQMPAIRKILGKWLSVGTLCDKEIPSPSSLVVRQIERLEDTATRARQMIAEFDRGRRQMVDFESFDEDWGRLLLKAQAIDDIIDIFKTPGRLYQRSYPLPLAFAWRSLAALDSPKERYPQILRAIEATLVFTACCLIVDRRGRCSGWRPLEILLEKITGKGPTAGEWYGLIEACHETDESIMPELVRRLRDPKGVWKKEVPIFLALRNDNSHTRGPNATPEFERLGSRAQKILDALYEDLAILIDTSLVQIDRYRFDSLNGEHHIDYRTLVGDHNVLRTETRQVTQVVSEGLHLQIGDDLHQISPWLIFEESPTTGQWEVSHPERLSADNGLEYKGLPSGKLSHPKSGALERLERFAGLPPS